MPSIRPRLGRLRPRAPLIALALTLLAHALLLGALEPPARRAAPAAVARPVFNLRLAQAAPPSPKSPASPATPRAVQAPPAPPPAEPLPAGGIASSAETAAPVFSTATAPSLQWRYQLRQNGQTGTALLSWQVEAGHYVAELRRELGAQALPGWRSEGEVAAEGLLPQRYATQRRGRDAQATNFRRDEGLISFSASPQRLALPVGVQDRLSWWLQLAAIIAAEPARFPSGSRIALPVAGPRGQLHEWRFVVGAIETVVLADGRPRAALHVQREGDGQTELGIELWLDPARHHLPLRLLQRWGGAERYELLLDEGAPP